MEMYRREQFREDLLSEQARDIANLEARLNELDSMLLRELRPSSR
jgi:hypothetical protein